MRLMSHSLRGKISQQSSLIRELPVGLVAIMAALICVGLLFIWSAGTDLQSENLRSTAYVSRQLMFVTVGGIAFLVMALIDYRFWLKWYWLAWPTGMLMLLACALFGREINGAKSWIVIAGFGIQVAEFCKLIFVVMLAGMLRYKTGMNTAKAILVPGLAAIIMLGVIIYQPDFGTAMVFVPIFFTLALTSGGPRKVLFGLLGIGAAALPLLYYFNAFKAHQMARINTYLAALTGAPMDRSGDAYHVTQSMNAVGAGGLTGRGFGDSVASQFGYLPERHTDFIFSVMAEEVGFLGSAAFVILFFGLVTSCLVIAARATDQFGRLVAVGIATMLMAQFFINVGMTCGLTPVTGIPLPLISYGGSALLAVMASLGLVASVHLHPGRNGVRLRD